MSPSEWRLVRFLRVYAAVVLLAVVPAVAPWDALAAVNTRLGLDDLPHTPVVEYLTRTTCWLFAYHGALVLWLSFDVRRYRPLIAFHGWLNFAGTVLVLAMDLWISLPAWWAVSEAVAVAVTGAVMLGLLRRCPPPG